MIKSERGANLARGLRRHHAVAALTRIPDEARLLGIGADHGLMVGREVRKPAQRLFGRSTFMLVTLSIRSIATAMS